MHEAVTKSERGKSETQSYIGPGSCPDDTQEKEKIGKDILKDIFGKDFVDNLEDLKQKIQQDDTRVILADTELEISEELEKEAKEKNIIIGRAQCGAFTMRGKCPIPMQLPFLFPEGFLR